LGFSQTRTITGTVFQGITGKPVSDVIVNIEGSKDTCKTNSMGEYSLTISDTLQNILFSDFEGMDLLEIKIVDHDMIDIYLTEVDLMSLSIEELMKIKITTAGKKEQKISDVPASVVVITREEIERYGYRTLSEILENISGMFMINDYGWDGVKFGVRGFWNVIANDDLMIFVNDIDQVNIPYSAYGLNKITVPVEAIERIEIIRGPMSVLYGSGAFFGVINIFTKNFDSANSKTNVVVSSIGTQQTGKIALHVSNKSKDFNCAINSSVFTSSGINQPYSKMNDDISIFKTNSTQGLLTQQELYFNFRGEFKQFYTDFSYNEANNGQMFLLPSAGNGSLTANRASIIAIGYKNKFSDKILIDGKLTYFSSYLKANYDHFFPNTYEYQSIPSTAYDIDLTLNSKLSEKLNLTCGVKFRSILTVENNLHLPTAGFGFYYNTTQTIDENDNIDSWAGFAQFEYNPVTKLKFVVGGRIEQQLDFTLKTIVADTTIGIPANVNSAKYGQSDLQFIPRIAAIFSITNNNIIKFLYGKAVNNPSWFQIQNSGEHGLDLRNEKIESYELNYIAQPYPKLIINTSLFYNKLNNLIVRTHGLNSQNLYYSFNANTGKVETKGMELTLQIKAIEFLHTELSCSYQKTTDKTYPDMTYSYSPNFLGHLKMSYQINSHISSSILMNYVDKMEANWLSNPDGTGIRIGQSVPSYYTIGANIRVSNLFGYALFFEIHGTNLLNHDVLYPATTNINTLFPKGTVGIGRQILFSLGYKF
jgi:outer membrane receptor for ferrienterochelin and colicin